MQKMPSQRAGVICSCSQNRDRSATTTYANDVAGSTKVTSAHESAVRYEAKNPIKRITPASTDGSFSAATRGLRWCSETGPICFIPTARKVSPSAEVSVTMARMMYRRRVIEGIASGKGGPKAAFVLDAGGRRSDSGVHDRRGLHRLLLLGVLDDAVALRAQLHEAFGFLIQTRHVAVHNGLPDHASCCLGPEIILVVEAVNHLQHILGRQAGIFDVSHLMPTRVRHVMVGDKTILLGKVIKLGARICVRDRDLDGLAIQRLSKVDGVADGFSGFARQAEDEVGVHGEAQI